MHWNYLPRRFAAASLAAVMLMTPALAAFQDTENHWAGGVIEKWSQEYHIINGYEDNTFRPEDPITRGAFAGILDRLMHFQKVSAPDTFSDTAGNYWEQEILKLHASGVYLGNQGKALPQDSITRQQAVTMLARAFDVRKDEDGELIYWDAANIAEYAKDSVIAMTDWGYLNDAWDGNFRPTDPITRGEFVNILGNMIQILIQTPAEYTGKLEGTVMVNAAEGASFKNAEITRDLIIAPGVLQPIRLDQTEVRGRILNFSGIDPVIVEEQKPENPQQPETPEKPALKPEDVYTPGETTGEFITYDHKQIPVYKGVEKNRFVQGDFQWVPKDDPEKKPDRLEYVGDDFKTEFGIDVSAYQNRHTETATGSSELDWDRIRRDGVDFVMVRAGLRGTSTGEIHEDAYFRQNVQGAVEAGLETGVYFFAQAITVEEAIEEADTVIRLLKELEEETGVRIDGPVSYDWEMHDSTYRVYGTSPEMATACAVAFCERIEEAGYEAMAYAGQYVSYKKYDQGALDKYARWYPEYKSDQSEKLYPQLYYMMDYWQFSSKCTIDGISGYVDANIHFLR